MEWIHAIAGRQWVLGLLVLALALALPRPGARAPFASGPSTIGRTHSAA
jgi:hypothetical protein